MSVVGARPQFVKLAPIAKQMLSTTHRHLIVHTGQHYDPLLSDVFFDDLKIPTPDVHLGVGSGGHGAQTGAILAGMDEVLEEHKPDCVLVYGDTNSTLAAALSAVKLHYPVVHLEAGLRSGNRRMPEEHNRILTDHAADLCLAPTEAAMGNLGAEGLGSRSVLVGDVMTDILFGVRDSVLALADLPVGRASLASTGYFLATIHRADNTDDRVRLARIVSSLAVLPRPVVLLAHPRLKAKAAEFGINLAVGSIVLSEPLPYLQLVPALMGSSGIITDSGGLQKEAFLLRIPCTTIRGETEWSETLRLGWNVLVETEAEILESATRPCPLPTDEMPYGDGAAAEKVIEEISARFC